jgi:hypothetical protein
VVRFDERENPTVRLADDGTIAVSDSLKTGSELFPPLASDVGGWLYLNLNNGGSAAYAAAPQYDLLTDSSTVRGVRQSQAWITTRMAAEGRYGVAFDATALGNGCSPAPASPSLASANAVLRPIGPAPDRPNGAPVTGTITHRNDDSCDIALLPAATLLLPFFQVEVSEPVDHATTTLVTIVNTSNQPQIARATIWTDWAYPVLTFDIFLTGYDVQAINLYDLLVDGRLPGSGTRSSPFGARSANANPRFLPSAQSSCASLPNAIPAALLANVRRALTQGLEENCGNIRLGGTHAAAFGYVTVDLVATCSAKSPRDIGSVEELLFDNVLTGDYQVLDPTATSGNYAFGSPLVHIRAIPEGGAAGEQIATNLPRTFYERLYGETHRDRRQPLPSAFAARYIEAGYTSFFTLFAVWREAATQAGASCFAYAQNSDMEVAEVVRFDERENPTTTIPDIVIPGAQHEITLPASALVASYSTLFPPLESGDVAGWMYLNLAGPETGPSGAQTPMPNQAWVVTTMTAEGRYGVAFDATALANGCTPPRKLSTELDPIAPSPVP